MTFRGNDPGLDLAALQALRPTTARTDPVALTAIRDRIAEHLRRHDGYLAFSGGKDSLVVLDLVRRVEPDVPVVFFDSGLEYPETYDYIRDLAREWSLDLHRIPADPPLLDVLAASGLWDHRATSPGGALPDLHEVLISGPSKRAHELLGPGELWGVRADESAGRRAMYTRGGRRDGIVERIDATVAYGPIWNWSTAEVWSHIRRHDLPVNPVYAKLIALGVPEQHQRISHVIDGNHLERGRLTWLQRGWPALFEQLAHTLPRIRHMT
ncbi:phosphoadenosine phosphosulfate reductase [Rhodococcus erythropolis]|uniref:phosphoadenosine phosphosulfate reductase family protein n=1 Tax=Rhodococcus erythropolis TaxID=1833 RepID=UPI0021685C66|nr:phosphoadenosine phosphosulfate reductase family protein [Rhodococcus erythropolis]MCS4255970.1 phosphoadenosine phosphosulfate reductase [Rhodococcus erythropolis]MCW2425487.1 phosphoadenosine phosphosulfate reductase [Rhodococcus erythropolis]